MSLDQNLFTLLVTPNAKDANISDLVDPAGTVHYRKERVPGSVYTINVYDGFAESLLATVSAPSATSKAKTIQLHNPSVPVQLKYAGTLTFRWRFTWEEHEFEWRREECYMIRKPDPPVLVAITKEPAGRLKSNCVQILDYNLNRFDISDRKGLEIVMLTALLTFHDASDEHHSDSSQGTNAVSTSPRPSSSRLASDQDQSEMVVSDSYTLGPPPMVPPRPVKTGAQKIAELQGPEIGEVEVFEEGTYQEYAEYCSNLLQGDDMLFITLHSSSASTVPKVLHIVEQVKRLRHQSGLDDGNDTLHHYVLDESQIVRNGRKAPRVINLDDTNPRDKMKNYKPPSSISIHLSKIPMPELEPRPIPKSPNLSEWLSPPESKDKDKSKGKQKEDKKKEKEDKKKDKNKRNASPMPPHGDTYLAPGRNTLTKASSSPHLHTPAHQVHPYQLSPSPSQINNPYIYAAPPPPPPMPYPSYSYELPSFLPGAERPTTVSKVTNMFDKLRTR